MKLNPLRTFDRPERHVQVRLTWELAQFCQCPAQADKFFSELRLVNVVDDLELFCCESLLDPLSLCCAVLCSCKLALVCCLELLRIL